MMKNVLLLIPFFIFAGFFVNAQKWIDTTYNFQVINDTSYGNAIDFAGTTRNLKMDIAFPTNDTPPICGRPLLVAIHGGAFIAGDKGADLPPYLLKYFAKRGYVTASINYRLGMFQTNSLINCNVSALGLPWNCLNMTDTAEWFRANYRGMQDAKGAIRFLINHAADFNIDPRNVFVVGESAGGFIALSTVFMDDNTEKPIQCSALNAVPAPNSIYENQCIVSPGMASNIASMNLNRPDLGSIDGDLNTTTSPYIIKGIGNFYGGILSQNLFTTSSYSNAPSIYFFHQPNDLVVPYNFNRVLDGEAYCYTQAPANCQWIINRPFTLGSKGIKNQIDGLTISPNLIPTYLFDSTNNNADCFTQISNSSTVGHAVDNFWIRTNKMAQFFAPKIDSSINCSVLNITNNITLPNPYSISPNPANEYFTLQGDTQNIKELLITDINGKIISTKIQQNFSQKIELPTLNAGIYFIKIITIDHTYQSKLTIIR